MVNCAKYFLFLTARGLPCYPKELQSDGAFQPDAYPRGIVFLLLLKMQLQVDPYDPPDMGEILCEILYKFGRLPLYILNEYLYILPHLQD